MRAEILAITVLAAAFLSGCNSEPERSYEWYLENIDAAREKATQCSEMSVSQAEADGNCARARKALSDRRPANIIFGKK